MTASIPYTIIGGYLGAGKTTLLNHLLRHSEGRRLAILVNDFGDINIDAELITSHDGETMNLANGCICCSLADGFTLALNRLARRAGEIDHIVVEASGVADPVKIGQIGAALHLGPGAVIVLADAEQVREKAANKYVGETVIRQLRGADLLVLNKIDLVDENGATAVRAWLDEVAPGVPHMATTHGRLPPDLLLGRHATAERNQPADNEHHRHVDYETWSFTCGEPLAETAVRALAEQLPDAVLRAKGYVYLADDPARSYLLQRVGRRWTLAVAGTWGEQEPLTQLVFIGLPDSMDAAAWTAVLRGRGAPS